jgi:enoyl reductase-like protein
MLPLLTMPAEGLPDLYRAIHDEQPEVIKQFVEEYPQYIDAKMKTVVVFFFFISCRSYLKF